MRSTVDGAGALLALTLAAPALLAGCALRFVERPGANESSTPQRVVVAGRINYIIDGRSQAPYGAIVPSWPAPRVNAVRLETGEVHATPLVDDADGAFRWVLAPGAYLVTRIGFGSFGDDTYIAWPGVVLCVPPLAGGELYAGHLQLLGTRYDEPVELSTGTRYRARGVHYRYAVVDERAGATPPAMQVRPDLPAGDALAAAYTADRGAPVRRACPAKAAG